jgi:hypothetical protein
MNCSIARKDRSHCGGVEGDVRADQARLLQQIVSVSFCSLVGIIWAEHAVLTPVLSKLGRVPLCIT